MTYIGMIALHMTWDLSLPLFQILSFGIQECHSVYVLNAMRACHIKTQVFVWSLLSRLVGHGSVEWVRGMALEGFDH